MKEERSKFDMEFRAVFDLVFWFYKMGSRDGSVYPRRWSLFISACTVTVGRPWQSGLRATLRR